jgi:hypothetical protein
LSDGRASDKSDQGAEDHAQWSGDTQHWAKDEADRAAHDHSVA